MFGNVGMVGSKPIDLIVTATKNDKFKAPARQAHGIEGPYGKIVVPSGSWIALKFKLAYSVDHSAATAPQFYFSVFNLDTHFGGASGEAVGIDEFDEYVVEGSTELKVMTGADGLTWFGATGYGKEGNLPANPSDMTDLQKNRAVTFSFKDTSEFSMTFQVGEGSGSRSFYFAGISALSECCSGEPQPTTTAKPQLPPATTTAPPATAAALLPVLQPFFFPAGTAAGSGSGLKSPFTSAAGNAAAGPSGMGTNIA